MNALHWRALACLVAATAGTAACEKIRDRVAAAGADDDGCDMVRAQAHPDPVELVREYVRRDGEGQFLESDDWLTSSLECPGHMPGHDAATLVAGYAVIPLAQRPDTARIGVTYQRLGHLHPDGSGSRYMREKAMEVDTFVVVRTVAGWRIAAPLLNQHVLPRAALARFRLSREDSQAIMPPRRQ